MAIFETKAMSSLTETARKADAEDNVTGSFTVRQWRYCDCGSSDKLRRYRETDSLDRKPTQSIHRLASVAALCVASS
jgi:hypothetical protein